MGSLGHSCLSLAVENVEISLSLSVCVLVLYVSDLLAMGESSVNSASESELLIITLSWA